MTMRMGERMSSLLAIGIILLPLYLPRVTAFAPSTIHGRTLQQQYQPNTSNICPRIHGNEMTCHGMSGISSIIKSIPVISTPTAIGIAGATLVGALGIQTYLDRPSRKYEDGSVKREYDAWTEDGILEYYWGEHIHLGYYSKEEYVWFYISFRSMYY